jgi:hypothetical protein
VRVALQDRRHAIVNPLDQFVRWHGDDRERLANLAAKASAQVGETAPSIGHDERRDLQQSKNRKAKK